VEGKQAFEGGKRKQEWTENRLIRQVCYSTCTLTLQAVHLRKVKVAMHVLMEGNELPMGRPEAMMKVICQTPAYIRFTLPDNFFVLSFSDSISFSGVLFSFGIYVLELLILDITTTPCTHKVP